jgi:glycosyltransferase involved in cell wall biosynthesis
MKVLLLSFTYPPSHHANAKRPYYVVKGMLKEGWNVHVITSQIGMNTSSDETNQQDNLVITRIPDPVESFAKSLKLSSRWKSRLHLALNGVVWPEYHRFWALRALRYAKPMLNDYDRVVCLIFPPSLFLAGRMGGMVDSRWIFDYQESITPYYRQYPRRSPLQKSLTPQLSQLEKQCLDRAGKVIFTAETNRDAYVTQGLVDAGKAKLIHHFYDDNAFASPQNLLDGFVIGYFGYFDAVGLRTPETFLKSLKRFLDECPEARKVTKFVFYGTWIDAHHLYIDENGLRDVVQIHKPIPLDDYLKAVQRCTVLLLLTSRNLNLFMPSKVVEYLGAGRPVLAFIPADSEVASVLKTAGNDRYIADETDDLAGASSLHLLWNQHRQGELKSKSIAGTNWAASKLLPEYIEVVRSATRPSLD